MNIPQFDINLIDKAICEKSFYEFVKLVWSYVCSEKFVDGKHIKIICDALQECSNRQNAKLLVNIAPGHSKSIITSILYSAWLWTQDPSLRIICGSHSLGLATDFSVATRQLIESEFYQSKWGDTVQLCSDTNTKTQFINTAHGERSISSPSSKPTGKSAEVIITDDAHDINNISDTALQDAVDWYEKGLMSRIRYPERGISIVIGQRVAQDDLSGHIIKKGTYKHICLPAVYDGGNNPYEFRTEIGEILWETIYNREYLDERKETLGTRSFETIYQQHPTNPGGNIIREDWLRYYHILPDKFEQIIQSWDLNFGEGKDVDYVVGQVWGKSGSNCYLIEQIRGRWGFTDTIREIRNLTARYPNATVKLIENKANGAAAISTLKNEISGIIPVNPSKNKLIRLQAVEGIIEAGNVYLPSNAKFLNDFVYEITNFTGTSSDKNDDQVDAMTQALQRFTSNKQKQVVVSSYA